MCVRVTTMVMLGWPRAVASPGTSVVTTACVHGSMPERRDGILDGVMAPPTTPRFSLVIPARNEENYLPRLLDSVDEARRRYAGGFDAVEVIVADNVSTDRTTAVARERGCRMVIVEKRVIGAVRNGGAAVARGEVLAFVDADARIHPGTFDAIERALATGKVVAGATGVRMERMSLGIAAAWVMMVPIVWLTGMDTGLSFCRREDFVAVGGYDESRLIAEDVEILWKLRRLGRQRRQGLARVTEAKAIASTRKWDEHGDWHYALMLLKLPYFVSFGRAEMAALTQRYWYDRRS
jgi:glycosyltransferase involved in cell wall biosynthesis